MKCLTVLQEVSLCDNMLIVLLEVTVWLLTVLQEVSLKFVWHVDRFAGGHCMSTDYFAGGQFVWQQCWLFCRSVWLHCDCFAGGQLVWTMLTVLQGVSFCDNNVDCFARVHFVWLRFDCCTRGLCVTTSEYFGGGFCATVPVLQEATLCDNASFVLQEVTLCHSALPILQEVTLCNNTSVVLQEVTLCHSALPILQEVTLCNNTSIVLQEVTLRHSASPFLQEVTLCASCLICSHHSAWAWCTWCVSSLTKSASSSLSPAALQTLKGECCVHLLMSFLTS